MMVGMARQPLEWTNPKRVDCSKPYLYFFRTVDPGTGTEYRYIGKSDRRRGCRLKEYVRNVARIFRGQPRGTTQRYRAVHLAMAKACEFGWDYDFFPLENNLLFELDQIEGVRVEELSCNLNRGRPWSVEKYSQLSVDDVLQ